MYSLKDLSDSHETLVNLRIKHVNEISEWEFLRILTKQLEYRILQYLIENTYMLYFGEGNKMIEFYTKYWNNRKKEKNVDNHPKKKRHR